VETGNNNEGRVPVLVFFIGVLAHMAWRYFRNGRSLTGTLLGGRIRREVGEIPLSEGSLTSQVLRVLDMESPDGEHFIGLSVVSKAPRHARARRDNKARSGRRLRVRRQQSLDRPGRDPQPGRGVARGGHRRHRGSCTRLDAAGVVRCDEFEPLVQGFQAFWGSSPASIVHLVCKDAQTWE